MLREQQKNRIDVDKTVAASWLPVRPWDGHKGTFGKVCIVGGSVGLTGAPVLAAGAAARTGSGLVYLGVPKEVYPITAAMCLEAMPFPLPDRDGGISGEALFPILERLNGCNAGLIGPGLGRSSELAGVVRRLLEQVRLPMVLDADALYAIRNHKEVLKARREKGCVTVLTPHEGEFAYLGAALSKGCHMEYSDRKACEERIQERIWAANMFAEEYGCILVLKGPGTVTADPEGAVYVNTTGNSGMARGGSGDVLSGMVLSLLGQGMAPEKAAALAVWLHGCAGDLCRDEIGEFGMLPRDMVERIPAAFRLLFTRDQ
ncbi:NAD(P)H-hydrate dehydratase [bacterium 1XD21-13]|nr:NAD(P)H-hydrate dehydratase [bacterium 1XD21-13]